MRSTGLSELARRTAEPAISWLMQLTLDRPKLISLAAGFTDSESLPVNEAAELLHAVLKPGRRGQAALQYGSTAGESPPPPPHPPPALKREHPTNRHTSGEMLVIHRS